MKKKAQSQSLASVNMLFLAFRLDTNLLLLIIIKNTTVTHSINAFDQEFQSASELENLSFDIRQMKLQVIFKRGLLRWGVMLLATDHQNHLSDQQKPKDDQYFLQALLITERVLGSHHKDTIFR